MVNVQEPVRGVAKGGTTSSDEEEYELMRDSTIQVCCSAGTLHACTVKV